MKSSFSWAKEFFGSIEVPTLLRRRVVSMATTALQSPDGTITQTFSDQAERQGAYRALSNETLTQQAIARSVAAAAARRANRHRVVLVPVDPSSLSITDVDHAKGTGRVGADKTPSRGFLVISAVLVIAGVVSGLLAQQFWTRSDRKTSGHRDRTAFRQKETARWCDVLDSVQAIFAEHAPNCTPWFLLDRGGDSQHVIKHAIEHSCLMTVRSLHNRKLADGTLLHTSVRREKIAGTMTRAIRTTDGARVRNVTFNVRFKRVTLQFRDRLGKDKRRNLEVNVVHVVERDSPARKARIEWFLLTTREVKKPSDACEVVDAYAERFQIELMHHGWKSGLCNIERTQLRSAEAIQKWATITAAVTTEALFLTQKSRETPEAAATEYLSRAQLDATIVLLQPKGWEPGQTPSLALAVRWIAQIGGFVASNSGPPGKVTVGRGLERVNIAVLALTNARSRRKKASKNPKRTA